MAITGFEYTGLLNYQGRGINGQNTIHANRVLSGTLSYETNTTDIKGRVDGICTAQTLDTITQDETWTFSLETQDVDSAYLELLFGERFQVSPTYNLPYINTQRVGAGGVVTDAKIAGTLNAANVQVSLVTSGTYGLMRPLEVITTGSPTASQALVTAGQIQVLVGSIPEGAALKYSVKQALTNVDTLGYETAAQYLTTMSFVGMLCMNSNEKVGMQIPQLTRDGGFELSLSGDGNATLNFKATVPAGRRRPVYLSRQLIA